MKKIWKRMLALCLAMLFTGLFPVCGNCAAEAAVFSTDMPNADVLQSLDNEAQKPLFRFGDQYEIKDLWRECSRRFLRWFWNSAT